MYALPIRSPVTCGAPIDCPAVAPLLSICIPTHDGRASVLDRALASVRPQLAAGQQQRVQVCISDNGSRDETSEVIARHRPALGDALVEHRFEENQGFTSNLLKVVEIAGGDFCWLLGSDDEIEPGAVSTVLEVLDRHQGLTGVTTNRLTTDDRWPDDVWADDPQILPPPGRSLYHSASDIFAELAMLQDYISTQIVNRRLWHGAVDALGAERIAAEPVFPHLPVLGAMIERDPCWYWVREPCIRHRVGVESLDEPFGRDLVQYLIGVTADRARIWAAMFGKGSPHYRAAMRRTYIVQADRSSLAHTKVQARQTLRKEVRLLIEMTRYYSFLPEFWLRSFPVLLLPHSALPLVGRLRHRIGQALKQ